MLLQVNFLGYFITREIKPRQTDPEHLNDKKVVRDLQSINKVYFRISQSNQIKFWRPTNQFCVPHHSNI
jgi:hypothetical protein